jgi:uncharacterized protein YuzE
MTVILGDLEFDNVMYDGDADVLYLHVGDPAAAVGFEESPEGQALRYDARGHLVGVTIVNARWLLGAGRAGHHHAAEAHTGRPGRAGSRDRAEGLRCPVQGPVEAMDGSLTAESVEGQGTTFTVELPERSHRLLSGSPSRP